MVQVKKKLNQDNINTTMFSLQCLESMVKNCGSKIHQEIATKDTMDTMRSIALVSHLNKNLIEKPFVFFYF